MSMSFYAEFRSLEGSFMQLATFCYYQTTLAILAQLEERVLKGRIHRHVSPITH